MSNFITSAHWYRNRYIDREFGRLDDAITEMPELRVALGNPLIDHIGEVASNFVVPDKSSSTGMYFLNNSAFEQDKHPIVVVGPEEAASWHSNFFHFSRKQHKIISETSSQAGISPSQLEPTLELALNKMRIGRKAHNHAPNNQAGVYTAVCENNELGIFLTSRFLLRSRPITVIDTQPKPLSQFIEQLAIGEQIDKNPLIIGDKKYDIERKLLAELYHCSDILSKAEAELCSRKTEITDSAAYRSVLADYVLNLPADDQTFDPLRTYREYLNLKWLQLEKTQNDVIYGFSAYPFPYTYTRRNTDV